MDQLPPLRSEQEKLAIQREYDSLYYSHCKRNRLNEYEEWWMIVFDKLL